MFWANDVLTTKLYKKIKKEQDKKDRILGKYTCGGGKNKVFGVCRKCRYSIGLREEDINKNTI